MGNTVSDKKNARKFSLKLSLNTDKDLIDHLTKQPNVQKYLKDLIRQDILSKLSSLEKKPENE